MADEWPAIPSATILWARRRFSSGGRQQWAVVGASPGTLKVVTHSAGMDGWAEEQSVTGVQDVADVLGTFPDLAVLRAGAITQYGVEEAVIEPPVLVSMLTVDTTGGPEAAERWPGDTAGEWADFDSAVSEWSRRFDWFPRCASVNGARVTAVDIGGEHMQPVLVDDEDEDLVPIRELARSAWYSESGGAPISWDGGHALTLLAPGFGYVRAWGDNREWAESSDPFVAVPEDAHGLGQAVTDWVIETESDVSAALALEPLDPDGELAPEERQQWEELLEAVTIDFEVDLPVDAVHRLREKLAARSELYRRTRAALKGPRSQDGQELYAALDDAVADGVTGDVMAGNWENCSPAG